MIFSECQFFPAVKIVDKPIQSRRWPVSTCPLYFSPTEPGSPKMGRKSLKRTQPSLFIAHLSGDFYVCSFCKNQPVGISWPSFFSFASFKIFAPAAANCIPSPILFT